MANNRKATKCRLIQRVPVYDNPKSKERKLIGYRFVQHKKY